jgi:hypothetical protein
MGIAVGAIYLSIELALLRDALMWLIRIANAIRELAIYLGQQHRHYGQAARDVDRQNRRTKLHAFTDCKFVRHDLEPSKERAPTEMQAGP